MEQTPPPVNQSTRTMGFQEAIRKVLSNYVNFQGRASRAEYWWWFLFTFIIGAMFGVFEEASGLKIAGILSSLASLAFFLPSLGVLWRRLHDMGRAGGWAFIVFVPIVGWIILIVWLVQPGEPHTNRFGDVPEV